MDNYEYIIAGLPALQQAPTGASHADADRIMASIREQLSEKDNALVDALLRT